MSYEAKFASVFVNRVKRAKNPKKAKKPKKARKNVTRVGAK